MLFLHNKYTNNWSREVFITNFNNNTKPLTYGIKDLNND